MLKLLNRNLRLLCSHLRWLICRRSKPKVVIRRFRKLSSKARNGAETKPRVPALAAVHLNRQLGGAKSETPLRIATFNAALFFMVPIVPKAANFIEDANDNVLKKFERPKLRVSNNLPDNEISLLWNRSRTEKWVRCSQRKSSIEIECELFC
ncbi:hypothetical protein L484_027928 [Morus notabilis]|uniref:Uncharacterized protein n=1 Tax=Morus notabilis TaxID=981085 RepID=W9SFJ9_9ROSA|nr:hypothetical protein L484_027928 [Morus notabilis]